MPAGPSDHAFLRVHVFDRQIGARQVQNRFVIGHGGNQLARSKSLLGVRHVAGVVPQERLLLFEQLANGGDFVLAHVEWIFRTCIDRGRQNRVVDRVDYGNTAGIAFVPQQAPRLFFDIDQIGAVGDGGLTPILRNPIALPVGDDSRQILQAVNDVRPIAQSRFVDGSEHTRIAPYRYGIIARHGNVRLVAGAHLCKRLLFATEKRKTW